MCVCTHCNNRWTMRWLFSRLGRIDDAPRVCYALLHAPESLVLPCDCHGQCKWPPRGNGSALSLVVVDRADVGEEGQRMVQRLLQCVHTQKTVAPSSAERVCFSSQDTSSEPHRRQRTML